MSRNEQALRFAIIVGLFFVAAFGAWLVRREMQMRSADSSPADTGQSSPARDQLRNRIFALKEKHRQIVESKLSQRLGEVKKSTQQLRISVNELAGRLGENMREEPVEPFRPDLRFTDSFEGVCHVVFLDWRLTGGRAAYRLKVVYPEQDMPDDVLPKVRKGDRVSDFFLAREATRRRIGKNYEIKTLSADGKEKIQRGKHPDFRTIELWFEPRSGSGEAYSLEVADRDVDRENAELSGFKFVESFRWEIPLAKLLIHDDPNNEGRSLTVRQGSVFLYCGESYVVRKIRSDHMEISPTNNSSASFPLLLSDVAVVGTEHGLGGTE